METPVGDRQKGRGHMCLGKTAAMVPVLAEETVLFYWPVFATNVYICWCYVYTAMLLKRFSLCATNCDMET